MASVDGMSDMGIMNDADREQFEMLQRQEQDGTITDDGRMQLQEFRDRMSNM